MRLSEAIQEGSKLRPQAYNEYFDEFDTEISEGAEQDLCSCALGAAFEAIVGGPYIDETGHPCNATFLQATFPILKTEDVPCPECGQTEAKQIIKDLWATHGLRFKTVSLDAPLGDGEATFADTLIG